MTDTERTTTSHRTLMETANSFVDRYLGIEPEEEKPNAGKPALWQEARKPDRFAEIAAKHRNRRARKGAGAALDKALGIIEVQEGG